MQISRLIAGIAAVLALAFMACAPAVAQPPFHRGPHSHPMILAHPHPYHQYWFHPHHRHHHGHFIWIPGHREWVP